MSIWWPGSLSFLLYPSLVALVLAFVATGLYRRPGGINEVFAAYRRPPLLRKAIPLWCFALLLVFIGSWVGRLTYGAARAAQLLASGSLLFDRWDILLCCGFLLTLTCEALVAAHWLAYLAYCWLGSARYLLPQSRPIGDQAPPVAILIPSCDEAPETLIRSLGSASRLQYPDYQVYLVENSRNPERKREALALAAENGVQSIDLPNCGHKAGALNEALRRVGPHPTYFAVFDADQKVAPDFLSELVPLLEADGSLAFVQSAQIYENVEASWLTRGAGQQEMLMYDAILEGKSVRGRALCCGTNFLMRRQALEECAGWDESTLCEDLATSFQLHWRGWRSLYYRKALAAGLGPSDLEAYWKQHRRWAHGNTTVARQLVVRLLTQKPRPVPIGLALDYLWSAGFYIVALVLGVLATLPIVLLVLSRLVHANGSSAGSETLTSTDFLALSIYPFYAMAVMFPYVHMVLRGYPMRNLLQVQGLLVISVPVYLRAVIRSLLGHATAFEPSPKRLNRFANPLLKSPQTYQFIFLLLCGAMFLELASRNPFTPAAWIVLGWTFFYTFGLGHFFLFALDARSKARQALQRPSD